MKSFDEETVVFKLVYLCIFSVLIGLILCFFFTFFTREILPTHGEIEWDAYVAIGTIFLAFATFWLGLETRKISLNAQKTLEQEHKPYLFLDDVTVNIQTDDAIIKPIKGVAFSFKLYNSSKIPVEYICKSVQINLPTENFSLDDGKYFGFGNIIAQGKIDTFWMSLYQVKNPFPNGIEGQIEILFDYWNMDNSQLKKSLNRKINFIIFRENLGADWSLKWHYSDSAR